jgi:hypothetical protein
VTLFAVLETNETAVAPGRAPLSRIVSWLAADSPAAITVAVAKTMATAFALLIISSVNITPMPANVKRLLTWRIAS